MSSPQAPGRSRRAPLVVAACIPVVTLVLWLNTDTPLPSNPGFMPAFLTLVFSCQLLTAIMLVEQYRAGGGPRLLPLSAAYIWSGICVFLHALTFPDFFGPQGILGTPEDTAPWLWLGWNVGFPVLVGLTLAPWPAWLRRWMSQPRDRTRRVLLVHALTALAAAGFAFVAIGHVDVLPELMADQRYGDFSRSNGYGLLAITLAALIAAVVGVARRGDRGGLETWALVAIMASCADSWLVLSAEARWTVGWYSARGLALTAAIIVLLAMLREVMFLFGQAKDHAELLRKHNDTLVEAQTLRDHMVAVVSHDMRTPLTGLEGYLEVLAGGDLTPEQSARMIQRSRMLATRLSMMTEDLLGVATSSRGGLSLSPEDVDVAAALIECEAAFPDLDLRVSVTTGLQVRADPLRIQQVLANLVRNAQIYGTEPVRLTATPAGERFVQISVSDAGEGVPDEFVPHLFDAYTRATGTGRHGSGLGLSVVRDLVTAMSGSVHYDKLDNTFRVVLPATTRAGSRPSGPPEAARATDADELPDPPRQRAMVTD